MANTGLTITATPERRLLEVYIQAPLNGEISVIQYRQSVLRQNGVVKWAARDDTPIRSTAAQLADLEITTATGQKVKGAAILKMLDQLFDLVDPLV